MARSKRRMRKPGDWVFRGNAWDTAAGLIDSFGSYTQMGTTIVAGVGSAIAKILYDSHNRFVKMGMTVGNAFLWTAQSARAEGSRAKIFRVKGQVLVSPSTWALGSTLDIGFRFGAFEQDPASGGLLLDPLYSMYSLATSTQTQPSVWANDRQWAHERRFTQSFGDNTARWALNFNFPVRRSLAPNFCYAMYVEVATGSVNTVIRPFLQTYVVDEA